MRGEDSNNEPEFFSESDPSSCRIETRGGTVYWLSRADENGLRWIVREHLQSSDTNTMVVHKSSGEEDSDVDLSDKFQGRMRSDVELGFPFVIEVSDSSSRILSEPVVNIEVGNVPEMIFG